MIFICIIGITSFFLIFGYFNQLELYKKAEYNKLQGIARTAALSIDAQDHQYLFNTYKQQGDLETRADD